MPSSQAYPIHLIHWMIREVYLLEIRKCTCEVYLTSVNNTSQVLL